MAKKPLPKWLIKTQHGSWEPEIFISGIVLIGLLQLPKYLDEFRNFFYREIYGHDNVIDNLMGVLTTGIYWMIFGLVLHLFFRGIWIGLVGLSYVFPNGINEKKLGYAEKFEKVIRKIPDVSDQVINLEKISSSIFSINYLMFMSILGAYFFLVLSVIMPVYGFIILTDFTFAEAFDKSSSVNRIIVLYSNILVVFGGIYLFDFLSLGLIKRIKYVNRIYYPIYRFISVVTFSTLYRNIYYLLISNFKKWKVIVFLVLFTMITLFMIGVNTGSSSLSTSFSQLEFYGEEEENIIEAHNYDNMNKASKNLKATIQNDIITTNSLRLFISDRVRFKDSIRLVCDDRILDTKSDEYKLNCLKRFYKISLDDSIINISDWYFHEHPVTNNKGIITYIDISELNNGPHRIKVDLNRRSKNNNYADIPFYLDR